MKLSIIIPTFNSDSTINVCLDSIIAQTYVDFEVWVIDGLSTDNTIQIVESYVSTYPFIHLISELDSGIYDAMNKGIFNATGEWIYFMGCDDVLFDSKTLKLVFEIQKDEIENFDIVYGNVIFKEFDIHSNYHENFLLMDFMDTNINHQSMFYRKELFSKMGMYTLDYPIFADWEFNVRCFFSAKCNIKHIRTIIAIFSLQGASNKKTDSWISMKDQVIFSYLKHKPFLFKLIFSNKINNRVGVLKKIKYLAFAILIKIFKRMIVKKKYLAL